MLHTASEIAAKARVMLDKAQELQRLELRYGVGAPEHNVHKYLLDDIVSLAADIVNDGKNNG